MISEGVSNWFGVWIKIKKSEIDRLYALIHDILFDVGEGGGPPCPTSAEDLICADINIKYLERDLKTCGIIIVKH